MEYPVTLMIPEPIYRQAEAIATANQKSIAEVLIEQLATVPLPPPAPADPDEALMLREVDAYKAMHPELVKDYLGQWVAIHQGKLVDHDADEEALMERRLQAFPDQIVLVRKVEIEPERDLYMPSFRLAEI